MYYYRSSVTEGEEQRVEGSAILAVMALQQTHDLARSALPDAPVRHDLDAARSRPLRRRTARGLRRLADRLEPAPAASAGAR
jgi:hypothetical protein